MDEFSLREPLGSSEYAFPELSFPTIKSNEVNFVPKIWVKNLPAGISFSGIKHLFLTVGKPVKIFSPPNSDFAIVEFQFMNEAELAVRDLNNKPPYNLKVSLYIPKHLRKKKEDNFFDYDSKFEGIWPEHVSNQETIPSDNATKKTEDQKERREIQNFSIKLGYDPSIRMRQRRLDFKSQVECISLGRGFFYMGEQDRYIGGLEKFVRTSGQCKSKDQMTYSCENCNATTTKLCSFCSEPYCSRECLSKSGVYHTGDCANNKNNNPNDQLKGPCYQKPLQNSFGDLWDMPLKSDCEVVITTYITMETVFVRRIDDIWRDEFCRLCNDIAVASLEEHKFDKEPVPGDLVISKYYEDRSFYRARVCSLNEGKASIFFVDFGNTQETNVDDLKPLAENLKGFPAFAVRVHLSDVSGSSFESVKYYNKLTANRIPLTLKFKASTGQVILIDKDSKEVVNEMAALYILPSWKKDKSALSKLGEVLYLNSLKLQNITGGTKLNLTITHFAEDEFIDMEVFWATVLDTDEFFHANSEMYLKIKEYCDFLEGDYYLPRENELCLAKDKGEWHRCFNLKTSRTTCCLFFVDDGHSSYVETRDIRKMIPDFIEVPAQGICCTLPENPKLKTDKECQAKVVDYLKGIVGQRINNVVVLKQMGDAYCLSIPGLDELFGC